MAITIMFVLACIYFMLPAYLANMAPVFARSYRFLARPVDGGIKINGRDLFGKNKTWRGIVFSILVAGFTAIFQFYIYPLMPNFGLIDYSKFGLVLTAALLLGFGAILGDLVESFFKRRLAIKEGKPWIPFDQLDFVVGSVCLVLFVFNPGLEAVIIILIISPILHFLANFAGYYLKIRKSRF